MLPAGVLIDMFLETAVAREAPCHLVVEEEEDVVLALAEKVVEETRMRLVVAEEVRQAAALHGQTRHDPRRPKKNWMPRWRIISMPMAVLRSLLWRPRSLLRPAERPRHQLTLMILT